MSQPSLVSQALSNAFAIADAEAAQQPYLASIKTCNAMLFRDLQDTIDLIHIANDIFVSEESGSLGREFSLTGEDLQQMVRRYPDGVLWPITTAAAPGSGNFAVPMSVLLMVPATNSTSLLRIPFGLATRLGPKLWGSEWQAKLGPGAAFLLGMYSDENGLWYCSPVVAWVVADEDQRTITTAVMPILPEPLAARAQQEQIALPDAAEAFAKDFIQNEVGHVLTAKPRRF